MKTSKGSSTPAPPSSVGILSFSDVKMKGPQLSPEFVIGLTVVVILGLIILHVLT
ncbi:MAG: preprotein translocase subunit Sec61beta [Candidatus Diapherotrites archaeon]|nr:preprotein translocase subunit Sec61beta [Candidatus Diapherotrites archaeon]